MVDIQNLFSIYNCPDTLSKVFDPLRKALMMRLSAFLHSSHKSDELFIMNTFREFKTNKHIGCMNKATVANIMNMTNLTQS